MVKEEHVTSAAPTAPPSAAAAPDVASAVVGVGVSVAEAVAGGLWQRRLVSATRRILEGFKRPMPLPIFAIDLEVLEIGTALKKQRGGRLLNLRDMLEEAMVATCERAPGFKIRQLESDAYPVLLACVGGGAEAREPPGRSERAPSAVPSMASDRRGEEEHSRQVKTEGIGPRGRSPRAPSGKTRAWNGPSKGDSWDEGRDDSWKSRGDHWDYDRGWDAHDSTWGEDWNWRSPGGGGSSSGAGANGAKRSSSTGGREGGGRVEKRSRTDGSPTGRAKDEGKSKGESGSGGGAKGGSRGSSGGRVSNDSIEVLGVEVTMIMNNTIPIINLDKASIFDVNASWMLQNAVGCHSKADSLYKEVARPLAKQIMAECKRRQLADNDMEIWPVCVASRPDVVGIGTCGKRSVMIALVVAMALQEKGPKMQLAELDVLNLREPYEQLVKEVKALVWR